MAEDETNPTLKRGQKLLDDRLGQLIHERQTLARDAKLGLILLAVLLLLYREYIPMVAADYQIEHRLGEQVRSLVLLEGHLERLKRVVAEGIDPWQENVDAQIDIAFQRVVALDAFAEQLVAADADSRPTVPDFVRDCARKHGWILPYGSWSTEQSFPTLWQAIVDRCIIASIDGDFKPPARSTLANDFEAVRNDVNAAVEHARIVFEIAPLAATLTPTATPGSRAGALSTGATGPDSPPTPTPAALLASFDGMAPITVVLTTPTPAPSPTAPPLRETLDAIAWEVNWAARLTSRLPADSTDPVASVWWETYATEKGYRSLRSFRDNLFLRYVGPELFGSELPLNSEVSRQPGTSGRMTTALPLVSAEDPSAGLTRLMLQDLLGSLEETLDPVREEQSRLQAEIAEQTSELEAAVPDFAKPVLAIARPRYLVLGYPLLVAGIGAYLMVSYTMLKADVRQWRDEYRTEDMKPKVLDVGLAEPPMPVLAVLVAAPLILLVALWQTNDWPQLRNGDWRTALVVAVAIVIITAAGCYLYLKRPSASLRG